MRLPKYLSPSSIKTWETDRREYYLRYLCDMKSPKTAQTRPMAVGSSFDGKIKNVIEKMCGLPIRDYSSQIEAAVGTDGYTQAARDGDECMNFYRAAGGINRLLVSGVPRMEFSVQGPIPGTSNCIGGPVIVMGKPDLFYHIGGHAIIHDWKVSGFCSKASPAPGYVWDSKTGGCHRDTVPQVCRIGDQCLMIGKLFDWSDQLMTYGWLLGEPVGEPFLMQVHQITRGTSGLRLTEYRIEAQMGEQIALRERYIKVWEAIHSGRCFDLDLESDLAEQRMLDRVSLGLQDTAFNAVCGL